MNNISNEESDLSLGAFCRKVRVNQGMSADDVARRSGGEITKSYVVQIETRADLNPTVKKLKALAKGLGASEELIFRLARGTSHLPIPAEFQELQDKFVAMADWSEENRIDALNLMKAIYQTISEKERLRGAVR